MKTGSCRSRSRLRRASLCTIARHRAGEGAEAKVLERFAGVPGNCGPASACTAHDHLDIARRHSHLNLYVVSGLSVPYFRAAFDRACSRRAQNSSGPRSDSTRTMDYSRTSTSAARRANSTSRAPTEPTEHRAGAHHLSSPYRPAHQEPPNLKPPQDSRTSSSWIDPGRPHRPRHRRIPLDRIDHGRTARARRVCPLKSTPTMSLQPRGLRRRAARDALFNIMSGASTRRGEKYARAGPSGLGFDRLPEGIAEAWRAPRLLARHRRGGAPMRPRFVAHAPRRNSSVAGALKNEFPLFGERRNHLSHMRRRRRSPVVLDAERDFI